MTENQKTVLDAVEKLGTACDLQVCKECDLSYREIHATLKYLKRSGVIDTDDDGQYFVKEN